MAELALLLQATFSPDTRKDAETSLDALAFHTGFLPHVLRLVLDTAQDRAVRLAACILLKNVIKKRWDEDFMPVPDQDKATLRSELVPAMVTLSTTSNSAIRSQMADSVSLIATYDFPALWPDLIHQLVASLSQTDHLINLSVLETAHAIFQPWRSKVRSDDLFTEINLVLHTFMAPFLDLFRRTAQLTLAHGPPDLSRSQILLLDIYYDFSCQDLPPDLEDSHEEFFAPVTGWFQKFLAWEPQEFPDSASVASGIKARILEIVELYMKRYPEQLSKTSAVEAFVQAVWLLLKTTRADDSLVSPSLRFISTAIRSGHYTALFSSQDTIVTLVQGVVVPNVEMREHEVDQFEDDPLEFIRLDLSSTSFTADGSTPRQAAADVLQALVNSGYEAETTAIVSTWVSAGLQEYSTNPLQNWKAKDTAEYLFTAVANRGSTTQHGITATNPLVDVIKFFSDNVFDDLRNAQHSILRVNAIRFLLNFRGQLTKSQLSSVLPLLVQHVSSHNYVTCTYAAITIDRILFIKNQGRLLFSQGDVREIAPNLLDALLSKIESGGNAEKMAENDHLMKCVMRVIITARQSLAPSYERILIRLVNILGVVFKNPSNPNFDQFIFESLSGLMRFIVSGTPSTLPTFEQALFGPFTIILQQDVDQYIPYVFQILGQMLELHVTDVPTEYRNLLPFLLTPAVWQQKGSIPGLVKLLKAFLAKGSLDGQLGSVLAVIQQRLIPSKMNDGWGFELLHSVLQHVSPSDLRPYFKVIMVTLLTRIQTSKTDKFVYLFALFLMFSMAVNVDGLSPDYVICTVEEIQPQLWSQILRSFVIPQIPKMPVKDRKMAVVGLTRMLTQSEVMLREPNVQEWSPAFTALVRLFHEPQYLSGTSTEDPDAGLTEIDHEEQTAGYQAAYSRLAASESIPTDPVAYVQNPQGFLRQHLANVSVGSLLQAADAEAVRPFLQSLGYC